MLPTLLAQSTSSVSSMLMWILILIVVVLIGGFIVFTIRRRMLSQDDSVSVGSSGLLDHLHQLHKSGEIDDEEFARARSSILMKVQEDMDARKASEGHAG
jgi:uncharacterized membrane protein